MSVTTQSSRDSNVSLEMSSSSKDASPVPSFQSNGFFNFGGNSFNAGHDDGLKITSATLMASLKQLQLLEDRERRERGLPISQTILKPTKSSKSPMLMRHNPETIDNPDRHLMFKNLNEFTLTIPTDDKLAENDEAVEDITSITPDEMSSELLSICEEKEHLVSIILNDIQTFKTHQLSQMSHRTKQIAFQCKPFPIAMYDYPSLYGRCFNLSVNMKILSQSDYSNPQVAARVLSDLEILENSLYPIQSLDLTNLLNDVTIR